MTREIGSNRDEQKGTEPDGLRLGRRTMMAALGAVGFSLMGSQLVFTQESDERGGNANQPWYTWEDDVDAGDNSLTNLHGTDPDHLYTNAREADAVIWRDSEDVYQVDGPDGAVAIEEELMAAVRAAVDSLIDDRETAERVLVAAGSVVHAEDEVTGVDLPSHTTVDVAGEITIGSGARV